MPSHLRSIKGDLAFQRLSLQLLRASVTSVVIILFLAIWLAFHFPNCSREIFFTLSFFPIPIRRSCRKGIASPEISGADRTEKSYLDKVPCLLYFTI